MAKYGREIANSSLWVPGLGGKCRPSQQSWQRPFEERSRKSHLIEIVSGQSIKQHPGSRFSNQIISMIGRLLFWQLMRDLSGRQGQVGAVRPSRQRHAGAGSRALFPIDLVCPAEEKDQWGRFFISLITCAMDRRRQTSPFIPLFISPFISPAFQHHNKVYAELNSPK